MTGEETKEELFLHVLKTDAIIAELEDRMTGLEHQSPRYESLFKMHERVLFNRTRYLAAEALK